jgi:hypothetical protein
MMNNGLAILLSSRTVPSSEAGFAGMAGIR